MATLTSFVALSQQLIRDLQTLASEAKRRSPDVRQASEKSLEILKRTHSVEELSRHPDFIDPFIQACVSGNAKLTSIAMQSMQRISGIRCIAVEKMDPLLNALIASTELATDIQLKVLQLIPILFKTYADVITDRLLSKLFVCCTKLLHQPNRTSVLTGTVTATLQQLVNEVFDRCKIATDTSGPHEVALSNDKTVILNSYRYDAHIVLQNLSQLNDPHHYDDAIIEVKDISEDCVLEILEFLLSNHASYLCEFKDLLFLLRTKVVPLLLRIFSSSKSFPIVVRTARCTNLLLSMQFFENLELETEIMLWLLIHTLSKESDSPMWKKILSMEIFEICSQDSALLANIFEFYDNHEERKNICASLLSAIETAVNSSEFKPLLNESNILSKGDAIIISPDTNSSKMPLLNLLDKTAPPLVDQTYVIYLLLSITNNFSDGIGTLSSNSDEVDLSDAKKKSLSALFCEAFSPLFRIHRKFLYCTTLDTHLFHSLVRAFQKLSLAAGILGRKAELQDCLSLFTVSIIDNVSRTDQPSCHPSSSGTVLGSISETLVSVATNIKDTQPDSQASEISVFQSRAFHQRNSNLFRALVSLSISLGSSFEKESWKLFLLTWQWVSYYMYGPTADFLEAMYGKASLPPSTVTKQELLAYEASVKKFVDSTVDFTSTALSCFMKTAITCSENAFSLSKDAHIVPVNDSGEPQFCPYNQSFFVTQMSDVLVSNHERIISASNEEGIWVLFNNYLVSRIANRGLYATALRLYLARLYSDTIVEISVKCVSDKQKPDEFSLQVQTVIMNSLLQLIDAIRALPISNDSVYNNDTNVESDIILQALKTLNDLLDSFGETLKSWDIVLKIINSPFDVMLNENPAAGHEGQENVSQVIVQKHKDMIQMSFEVFKLISDNFLQCLPLNYIRAMIDTLCNFVNQDRDLNISFSSISQFWLIADCLRMQSTDKITEKSDTDNNASMSTTADIEVIIEGDFTASEKLNALWIYLLVNLVNCSYDPRPEVKNGAVQTFFGILDSNVNNSISWNLIASQALKRLLSFELPSPNKNDYAEFVNLTFKGLLQVYFKRLSNFESDGSLVNHWLLLVDKIESLMNTSAYDVVHTACINFKQLLQMSKSVPSFPEEIVHKYYKSWCGYNVVYISTPIDDYRKKTNSDCLQAFVDCFAPLYDLMKRFSMIDSELLERCLATINAISRYPLLAHHLSDTNKPSSLQQSVLAALCAIDDVLPNNQQILVLSQLSSIIDLPFETRDRIKKKLSSKLNDATKTKIPSFEAVSYSAAELLSQRISNLDSLDLETIRSKGFAKLISNISQPIIKNSMLCTSKATGARVLWILSCNCFTAISKKLFEHLQKNPETRNEKIVIEYSGILLESLISSINKDGKSDDENTNKNAIEVYENLKQLLIRCLSLGLFDKESIYPFGSALWMNSFYYEIDEIEDALIKQCLNLDDIVKQFAHFDFDNVVGSTSEPIPLPNHELTGKCLQDLITFSTFENDMSHGIREVCFSFVIARFAFVLRKFIADQQLLSVQPISKIKSRELQQVSKGVLHVLAFYNTHAASGQDFSLLHDLYPLLLKAIPVAQKISGLQDILLQLALLYANLNK